MPFLCKRKLREKIPSRREFSGNSKTQRLLERSGVVNQRTYPVWMAD